MMALASLGLPTCSVIGIKIFSLRAVMTNFAGRMREAVDVPPIVFYLYHMAMFSRVHFLWHPFKCVDGIPIVTIISVVGIPNEHLPHLLFFCSL